MKEVLDKITFNIKKMDEDSVSANYDVTINVPMEIGWIERMKFITETSNGRIAHQLHHVKNENGFVTFKAKINLLTQAIYHYYFSFEANHNFIYYKKENMDNYKSISKNDMWKMSVNFKVPEWAKGKIMYHIFVDRFNKSNDSKLKEMPNRIIHHSWDEELMIGADENGRWNTDFYGGDLEGIIDKLDYIKSLGVSIIYLSPIVWSQSNHRYDAADYEKVDPYLGTNNDLKRLCDECHKRGIKVILDAVFNHTGNDSKYFNEFNTFNEIGAYQSKDSKYFPFYRKYYHNNKVFFDYWWGMTNLPVCDGNSREWQQYIYGENGIIDLWFKLGIDGLRLDVADELTDEFIEGIREAVKRNKPDGFILGEVWKNPMRMGRSYLESGKGMDSVMNYQLINALIRYYKYADYTLLNNIIHEILNEYPTDTINSLMNFTSTHDITRAINIFGCNEFQFNGEWAWNLKSNDRMYEKNYQISESEYNEGKKIYLSYISTLAFLPGILSIFYGDEIGLQGLGNLANRKTFTWNKIDQEILNLFLRIGKLRNKEHFLEEASLDILDLNSEYFAFKRKNDHEEALAYFSRSNENKKIILPTNYKDEKILYNLNQSNKEELSPYGGIVLKKTL